MENYIINGQAYTNDEIIGIMREQIARMPKYSRFADASIEFCSANKAEDYFFYVSSDDGNDMMVKVSQDGNIYWDWTGPIMDGSKKSLSKRHLICL